MRNKDVHLGQERGRVITACCRFYHLATAGEASPLHVGLLAPLPGLSLSPGSREEKRDFYKVN